MKSPFLKASLPSFLQTSAVAAKKKIKHNLCQSLVVVNNYKCISRAAKIWRFKICAFFLLHLLDLTDPLKSLDDVGSPPLPLHGTEPTQ